MGDGAAAAVRHVGLQAVSLPTHFSDGNLTQWLERFETCATANEWTPPQQLVRLPTFLEGRAYTLYRRLQAGERDTIEHLRENLSALFYPEEARETHRLELYNYKCNPDEDIDQFVYRLEQKFDQAHPELLGAAVADVRTGLLKDCFLRGLPDYYQRKLREMPGLTYQQAQLHARQYKASDFFEMSRSPTVVAQSARASSTNSDKEEIAALKAQLAALSLNNAASFSIRDPPIKQEPEWRTNASRPYTQSTRSQDNRYTDFCSEQRDRWENARTYNNQIQCYQCGGFGHTKHDCASKSRSSNRSNRNKDRSDSRDRDYHRRDRDQDSRDNDRDSRRRDDSRDRDHHRDRNDVRRGSDRDRGYSRRDRSNSTDRNRDSRRQDRSTSRDRRRDSPYPDSRDHHKFNPSHTEEEFLEFYVDAEIEGHNVRCFLDSGCAASSMSQDCYTSRFGHLESLEGKPEQAIAFNGTTSLIHGTFNTSVVFNQKSYPIAIKVVEASNYEFILGTDFLNKFKAIINLRDGILEIEGCAPILIAKQEINVSDPPVLHCASDVSVPPQSVAYLACTRVGAVSRKATAMCLSETTSFASGTGLLLANGIINPQSKIFVQVVNVTASPIQVRNGTKISALAECEELPFACSKTVRTNSLKLIDRKSLELNELGTDVSSLTKSESTQLQSLVDKYQHLFAKEKDAAGRTNLVEHHIDLVEGSRPFKHSSRRFPIHLQEEADKEVQKMLDAGIVEPSTSEFSSPPVLVRKKDGGIRFCVDYRKLNQSTIKDSYPLPRINEAIDSIGSDSKYFMTLDLAISYHHVPIAHEDKHKTAFTSRYGLVQYTAIPFGLTNAPATFQRLMERVLAHMNWKDCLVYIDDVLIWSKPFRIIWKNSNQFSARSTKLE